MIRRGMQDTGRFQREPRTRVTSTAQAQQTTSVLRARRPLQSLSNLSGSVPALMTRPAQQTRITTDDFVEEDARAVSLNTVSLEATMPRELMASTDHMVVTPNTVSLEATMPGALTEATDRVEVSPDTVPMTLTAPPGD